MSSAPLDDVWASRDLPVLVEVARRVDVGDILPDAMSVAEALGMTLEQVSLAARALKRRGLVDYVGSMGLAVMNFQNLSGRAYFLTGLHPDGDNAISQLVSALREAADEAADPDEKSRLRRLADGVGDVSREILGGVLTSVITAAGRGMLG